VDGVGAREHHEARNQIDAVGAGQVLGGAEEGPKRLQENDSSAGEQGDYEWSIRMTEETHAGAPTKTVPCAQRVRDTEIPAVGKGCNAVALTDL
jgi:hypothetical protein